METDDPEPKRPGPIAPVVITISMLINIVTYNGSWSWGERVAWGSIYFLIIWLSVKVYQRDHEQWRTDLARWKRREEWRKLNTK